MGWGGVGWDDNVIGIATWCWCYALWSSLAIPHDLDATLYDLHWQFHMIFMLRSMIFNCHCTHPHPIVWGGVGWDDNVIGISTWCWCYALWSSLAIPHDLDATLYDLHWHVHMMLMLRSMIFIGNSTWSWCYALWSSLAIPHDLDATLYDLHWQFHMILMLRYPQIWKCMRSFQWRWKCTGKNLMETTADTLKKKWEKVAVALFQAEVMEGLLFTK